MRLLKFSISIISLVLGSYFSFGQDLVTTVRIADELFSEGEFGTSAELYKRVIYFDTEEKYDSISFAMLAMASFHNQDYTEAANKFEVAYQVSGNLDYYFDMVLCHIIDGNFKMAKINLLILSTPEDHFLIMRYVLLSLVEYKLGDYDKSQEYYDQLLDLDSTFQNMSTIHFSMDAKKIKRKYKKSKVKLMSLVLPGAGQMYCGNFKEGLNSLAITVIFGGLYFNVANSLGLIDAIIIVLPWYQKYYVGGYNKAGEIALKKQNVELNKIFNRLLRQYQMGLVLSN